MIISEPFFFFFFLHKHCLNNLTMAHQSFLQHFPTSSIRPQLMEDLWFIMGWRGQRQGGSGVDWCCCVVVFLFLNCFVFLFESPL